MTSHTKIASSPQAKNRTLEGLAAETFRNVFRSPTSYDLPWEFGPVLERELTAMERALCERALTEAATAHHQLRDTFEFFRDSECADAALSGPHARARLVELHDDEGMREVWMRPGADGPPMWDYLSEIGEGGMRAIWNRAAAPSRAERFLRLSRAVGAS